MKMSIRPAKITRRDLIKAGGAGLSALALGTPLFATEARRRPNVLLITTDQQRVDVMSAVGNPWAKTPHMDSIAAQGVSFTKSYCVYPLCSPSRSSLHTGRTPHEDRVDTNGVAIDPAIPLSGQAFRAAGYDTGYAGKWHCPAPFPPPASPDTRCSTRSQRNRPNWPTTSISGP